MASVETPRGSLAPGQIGGRKKRMLSGESAQWLKQRMREAPFMPRGLVAEPAEQGVESEPHAMWVFAHAQGLS